MLNYRLLKNCAGLLLTGDYETLKALHDVVHDVNERTPLFDNKEGAFLGLAYDIRKAYEGRRRTFKPPEGYPEIGPCFGVEILWPVLLWQCRTLRESMAFIDTSKRMQAHAFALEAVIESGLTDDFGGDVAAQVITELERIHVSHSHSEQALNSRGAMFSSWTKAQRRNGIVGIIASLNPLYSTTYDTWVRNGVKHLVAPEDYGQWDGVEWPDPKW